MPTTPHKGGTIWSLLLHRAASSACRCQQKPVITRSNKQPLDNGCSESTHRRLPDSTLTGAHSSSRSPAMSSSAAYPRTDKKLEVVITHIEQKSRKIEGLLKK